MAFKKAHGTADVEERLEAKVSFIKNGNEPRLVEDWLASAIVGVPVFQPGQKRAIGAIFIGDGRAGGLQWHGRRAPVRFAGAGVVAGRDIFPGVLVTIVKDSAADIRRSATGGEAGIDRRIFSNLRRLSRFLE